MSQKRHSHRNVTHRPSKRLMSSLLPILQQQQQKNIILTITIKKNEIEHKNAAQERE